MMSQRTLTYSLITVLALVFCGVPECMHALVQEPAAQEPSAQQNQQQGQEPGVTVDPSKGPLSPAPVTEPAQPATQPQKELPARPTPQTTILQQQSGQQEPLGAATAGSVRTEGGLASRPAGNAIAPAKQHQTRSWLIKMGAVAAAGIAIGTVYALSKGTSSVPPNSGR